MFKKLFGMIACLALASSASAATTSLVDTDFDSLTDGTVTTTNLDGVTTGGGWTFNGTRGATFTASEATGPDVAINFDDNSGDATNGFINFATLSLSSAATLSDTESISLTTRAATGRANGTAGDLDRRMVYVLNDSAGNDLINLTFWYTGASDTIPVNNSFLQVNGGSANSLGANIQFGPDNWLDHLDSKPGTVAADVALTLYESTFDVSFGSHTATGVNYLGGGNGTLGSFEIASDIINSSTNASVGGYLDDLSITQPGPSTISLDLNNNNSGDINLAAGDNVFDFAATNGDTGFNVEYLIVGGGGGGGGSYNNTGAGGGGAGELLEGTGATITGAEEIVVGDGGDGTFGGNDNGENGDPSEAFGLTAIGGGGGAGTRADKDGSNGGSGGGGAGGYNGGLSTATGQGNDGGDSTAANIGGGGGGAGGVGDSGASGGAGGAGVTSSITGTSVEYAAGGNGGIYDGSVTNGDNGGANTGQGGDGSRSAGGSSSAAAGGKGGSGIVVVRYTGDNLLTGGTVSTVGSDTVHTFTDVGSSTLGFNATINGVISGGADTNLLWNGGGTLTLNGANTYTGTTTIDSGNTLQIGSGGTTGTLGTGVVTNNGALVFNRSDPTTITNDVSGTGSVEHAGSGTLELTGTLSYDGPTSVTGGGILEVADGSFGTLSVGNGTLSIDSSGIGQINLGGNVLTLGNGAVINMDIQSAGTGGTDYDQIKSSSSLVLTDLPENAITINIDILGSVNKGDTFKLFDGDVTGFSENMFKIIGANEGYWTIANGSLLLTSTIPEPSTVILAGLGLMGVGFRRRRK